MKSVIQQALDSTDAAERETTTMASSRIEADSADSRQDDLIVNIQYSDESDSL